MTNPASEVVVVRMSRQSLQRLDAAAHSRGIKRSELVRQVIEANLAGSMDLADEARQQSLRTSRRKSERDAVDFIASTMATDDWE